MINPVEIGLENHDAAVVALKAAGYTPEFQSVFSRDITIDDVAAAIAAFERTVISGDSAFDRFMAVDKSAMSESAQRGWALWNGKARCNTCHPFGDTTHNFSDNKFHNIGVAAKGRDFGAVARQAASVSDPAKLAFHPDFTELGRFVVTKQPKDIGAFKTPGLRDVALTAPYMHDGSEATLLNVVEFYDKPGRNVDPGSAEHLVEIPVKYSRPLGKGPDHLAMVDDDEFKVLRIMSRRGVPGHIN